MVPFLSLRLNEAKKWQKKFFRENCQHKKKGKRLGIKGDRGGNEMLGYKGDRGAPVARFTTFGDPQQPKKKGLKA
jgi:hypothetical protein